MRKDYLSDKPLGVVAPIVILPISVVAANLFSKFILHGHWTIFAVCFGTALMAAYQSTAVLKLRGAWPFILFYTAGNLMTPFLPFGDDSHLPLIATFPIIVGDYAIFYFGMNYFLSKLEN